MTTETLQIVFNPSSGGLAGSGDQLLALVSSLQDLGFAFQLFIVNSASNLPVAIQQAISQGIRTFVVCGGDGTVDSVASLLIDQNATIAVIPTGTQNNIATSLGIPLDIPGACNLLRSGMPKQVDMGKVIQNEHYQYFLEACSVGLFSALFPAADDIQHGNIPRLAELLATLVTFPLAQVKILINGETAIHTQSHAVLVTNMPMIGPHFTIPSASPIDDRKLDVVVFNDLTRMDLASYAALTSGTLPDQKTIIHHHAHSIHIEAQPAMPVLVDGFSFGQTPIEISVHRAAVTLLIPPS